MSVEGQPRLDGLPAVHEAWLPREHSLHRPRHGGRQVTALCCALVFFVVPTLSWLFGARPAEIDNRRLAPFPSVTSGWGFFTGLSQWATDHLLFRGAAVQAESGISRSVFGEPAPFDDGGSQQAGPLAGSPGGTGAAPAGPNGDHAGYPNVIQGKNGWLYFGQDVQNKCEPVHPLDQTIATLQRLRKAVEDSGRTFVLIVPPDKTTMVPQYLPDSYAGKECAQQASAVFWQRITSEAGAVDLRPMLQAATTKVGHPVYYQLDTHWTDEGAMMLAAGLAEHLQPGVTKTWTVQQGADWNAPADLPKLIGRTGENHGHLYTLAPDGLQNGTKQVPIPFEHPTEVTSPPGTGVVSGKVELLTDSFGYPASRYLAAGFSDITLLTYDSLGTYQAEAVNSLVDKKVIAIEAVERNVAAGDTAFLDPGLVTEMATVLAAHPMH